MKHAIVTGSAGFIGTHLCRRLEKEGWKVTGIDNYSHACKSPFKSLKCDITDKDNLEILAPAFKYADVVYHLAAQINVDESNRNPTQTLLNNVIGTMNILEMCRRFNLHMVFASTSEVYGSSQQDLMDENHPLDCQSPYGASKAAADRLCHAYNETYDMDVAIMRNFNTFGPLQNSDSYGGVIAKFAAAAIKGQDLTIFGTGEQERDYIWVDDAVEAYMLAQNMKGVKNTASGTTITVNRIAEIIIDETKSKSRIVHVGSRPGEVMRLCGDASKLRQFGWKPTVTIEEGIRRYVQDTILQTKV